MTTLLLHRIDPTRNIRRFHLLDLQSDFFEQWSFIHEWGRIGQPE